MKRLVGALTILSIGAAWLFTRAEPSFPDHSGQGLASRASHVQDPPVAPTRESAGPFGHEAGPASVDSVAPGSEASRESLPVPLSPLERAEALIRASARVGDVGIDHTVELLRRLARDNWVAARQQFVNRGATAQQYADNLDVNPLARKCTVEELARCQELIDEYARRAQQFKFDEYLLGQVGVVDAIQRGDFKVIPKGDPSDPQGQTGHLQEVKALLGARDFNAATVPGADLTHNRIIWFTRQSYPEFFAVRDAMDRERAEFQLAVRSYFLSLR